MTVRGHKVADVAERLSITTRSLYAWIRKFGPEAQKHEAASAAEIRKLKTELRRVTEERDILKKAAKYFAGESG